jgi:hypothetical protein
MGRAGGVAQQPSYSAKMKQGESPRTSVSYRSYWQHAHNGMQVFAMRI